MKIHEYQGKQVFQRYGILTPKGYPVFTAAEAEEAAKKRTKGGSKKKVAETKSETKDESESEE